MSEELQPIRRSAWRVRRGEAPWPPATQVLLLLTGVVLAGITFVGVLSMPDLPYHPARDLELRATYDTYRETGVPLLKENGTGSWYGAVEGSGLTRAAGDDDPGSYLVASWMSHLTGSDSPYPGLRWAMALLCALPLLILPLTVARVFRRARAGYAMLALPVVTWLVNKGTVLIGTEYGLSDQVSPVRVYALYGMAASLLFLNLVLVAFAATYRLGFKTLVALSALFVVLASASNLSRSLSGYGVALAVGVLWWLNWHRRMRPLVVAGASIAALVGSMFLPTFFMDRVDADREVLLTPQAASLPSAHGTWHPLYLGLSYPQPITGEPSPFGITWSDEFGWNKVREVDPDVLVASAEYDAIMKDLYLDEVKEKPVAAARLYLAKGLYVLKQFAAMIVLIVVGFVLAWRRPGPHRRLMGATVFIVLPTLAFSIAPTVLVMPMLYYYSELVAGLGLLSAVALGGLVWSYTTLPGFVRSSERRRLASRDAAQLVGAGSRALSVVVPSRNGADVLPATLDALGGALTTDDEIVVVENGSTDRTGEVLREVAEAWAHPCALVVTTSEPGLGNALRTGVLGSSGRRLLLTADDLPFGLSDLDSFRALSSDVVVAIGSKAHPGSRVVRSRLRSVQSRVFRWLRAAMLHSSVGDSQGTIWVDGPWARSFAGVSRETGLMWTVELVLAAEQQGLDIWEVPVELVPTHDSVTSRFRFRDAWIGVREIWQLALRKDDYAADEYPTVGSVLAARSG